jgi:hypothetical protein
VPLAAALVVVAAFGPAAAAAGPGGREVAGLVRVRGSLDAVAATSPRNAWAVGYTDVSVGHPDPLIAGWDGMSWRRVPGPALDTWPVRASQGHPDPVRVVPPRRMRRGPCMIPVQRAGRRT